jgi:hypothetical protein
MTVGWQRHEILDCDPLRFCKQWNQSQHGQGGALQQHRNGQSATANPALLAALLRVAIHKATA